VGGATKVGPAPAKVAEVRCGKGERDLPSELVAGALEREAKPEPEDLARLERRGEAQLEVDAQQAVGVGPNGARGLGEGGAEQPAPLRLDERDGHLLGPQKKLLVGVVLERQLRAEDSSNPPVERLIGDVARGDAGLAVGPPAVEQLEDGDPGARPGILDRPTNPGAAGRERRERDGDDGAEHGNSMATREPGGNATRRAAPERIRAISALPMTAGRLDAA
jgi:hypothetical protein